MEKSTFCSELAGTLQVGMSGLGLFRFLCESRTFWKYLQGCVWVTGSMECENGQAFPA